MEHTSSKEIVSNVAVKESEQQLQFAGKILLREEISLSEADFQKLLDHGQLAPIPSITSTTTTQECQRCHNKKRSLFARIDCARCQKNHMYCRKCIGMGRVLSCEPLYIWGGKEPTWEIHKEPCVWDGKLTNAQQVAADRIVQAIQNNEREILVWGVCGAGKTEITFRAVSTALQQGKRICLASPRADVVRELYPRFVDAFPMVSIQALYGGSEDKDGTAQLIIATTHQLLRYRQAFDILIIDEVDAFPYHVDSSLPSASKRSRKRKSTTIYMTATPRKEQQVQITAKKLPHVFIPIRFHGHPLPIPQLKMCYSLKRQLRHDEPPTPLITWLKKRNNQKRQLLIFVPTVQLAEQMVACLAPLLLHMGLIDKKEKIKSVHANDADRTEKVNAFRQKQLTIIVTTTILERGVTFPSVDVVVLDAGHRVFDEAALVQIAGRAGRSPLDPRGEIIFYHDGKTNAMVRAVKSIVAMNRRGRIGKQ